MKSNLNTTTGCLAPLLKHDISGVSIEYMGNSMKTLYHGLCVCLVAQLCLTLCDSMDCSPPGLLCPWDSPGKNTGVRCCFLLQGIFPTQGSNLVLFIAGRCFTIWATKAIPRQRYWISNISKPCESNDHYSAYRSSVIL